MTPTSPARARPCHRRVHDDRDRRLADGPRRPLRGHGQGPEALRGARLHRAAPVAGPGLAGMSLIDHGDVPIEPGWAADADPFMKNRDRIIEYLPRLATQVEAVIGEGAAGDRRLAAPAPRRRLHVARRGDGRPQAPLPGRRASRSPGSTPTATSTRPTHHAVGQRLGHALRDALRPRRPRPREGLRGPDRPRGGRGAARRPGPRRAGVADARRLAGRPLRRRACSPAWPASPRSRRGPGSSAIGATGCTSPSTSTRSTHPSALGRDARARGTVASGRRSIAIRLLAAHEHRSSGFGRDRGDAPIRLRPHEDTPTWSPSSPRRRSAPRPDGDDASRPRTPWRGRQRSGRAPGRPRRRRGSGPASSTSPGGPSADDASLVDDDDAREEVRREADVVEHREDGRAVPLVEVRRGAP